MIPAAPVGENFPRLRGRAFGGYTILKTKHKILNTPF
jgi:hypothetical protein